MRAARVAVPRRPTFRRTGKALDSAAAYALLPLVLIASAVAVPLSPLELPIITEAAAQGLISALLTGQVGIVGVSFVVLVFVFQAVQRSQPPAAGFRILRERAHLLTGASFAIGGIAADVISLLIVGELPASQVSTAVWFSGSVLVVTAGIVLKVYWEALRLLDPAEVREALIGEVQLTAAIDSQRDLERRMARAALEQRLPSGGSYSDFPPVPSADIRVFAPGEGIVSDIDLLQLARNIVFLQEMGLGPTTVLASIGTRVDAANAVAVVPDTTPARVQSLIARSFLVSQTLPAYDRARESLEWLKDTAIRSVRAGDGVGARAILRSYQRIEATVRDQFSALGVQFSPEVAGNMFPGEIPILYMVDRDLEEIIRAAFREGPSALLTEVISEPRRIAFEALRVGDFRGFKASVDLIGTYYWLARTADDHDKRLLGIDRTGSYLHDVGQALDERPLERIPYFVYLAQTWNRTLFAALEEGDASAYRDFARKFASLADVDWLLRRPGPDSLELRELGSLIERYRRATHLGLAGWTIHRAVEGEPAAIQRVILDEARDRCGDLQALTDILQSTDSFELDWSRWDYRATRRLKETEGASIDPERWLSWGYAVLALDFVNPSSAPKLAPSQRSAATVHSVEAAVGVLERLDGLVELRSDWLECLGDLAEGHREAARQYERQHEDAIISADLSSQAWNEFRCDYLARWYSESPLRPLLEEAGATVLCGGEPPPDAANIGEWPTVLAQRANFVDGPLRLPLMTPLHSPGRTETRFVVRQILDHAPPRAAVELGALPDGVTAAIARLVASGFSPDAILLCGPFEFRQEFQERLQRRRYGHLLDAGYIGDFDGVPAVVVDTVETSTIIVIDLARFGVLEQFVRDSEFEVRSNLRPITTDEEIEQALEMNPSLRVEGNEEGSSRRARLRVLVSFEQVARYRISEPDAAIILTREP